ncbi:cell envelope integrity EipB family protein [Zavarzinia compransoris]|uniref:cell envelope integrity EipB family protein n=1 Tax=Zavarzinia marina TaxID=2911065 RepID=UPI001F1AEC67|nr:cell envelope integrity EipB family protein [Zavarzinia marina]MCF4166633.1 cell envelope integrity EipB family protein [Zavarzinia marina]
MLRRALVLTTALVAIFFLARWAFFGGGEDAAAVDAAAGGEVPALVETVPESGTPPSDGTAAAGAVDEPAESDVAVNEVPAAAVAPKPAPESPPAAEAAPEPATDIRLAGHRAVYDLVLGRNRPGSGVAVAEGRMVIEFADVCDGYTLTQQLRMRLGDGEGSYSTTDFRVVNWESMDGKRFRFSTRHSVNGEEDEAYEGTAELKDGGGVVRYTRPEETTANLIPGTVFPTMHTVDLLRAARNDERFVTRTLFDGSDDTIASHVVGVIGGSAVADPPRLAEGKAGEMLRGRPSWPVRLAFFGIDDNEELPEYEVGFRLYDNGVSGDMEMAYGDFSIDALLTRIEAMPRPDC